MRLGDFAIVRSGSALTRGGETALYAVPSCVSAADVDCGMATLGCPPARGGEDARVNEGDVLVVLRGTTNLAGRVGSLEALDRPLFATLDLGVVHVADGETLPEYVAAYLNLPRTQTALAQHRTGMGAPRLPLSALSDLDVPLPSLRRQRAFVALAAEAEAERVLQEQMIEARKRLVGELLASSLEAEEPVPGCSPARVHERS